MVGFRSLELSIIIFELRVFAFKKLNKKELKNKKMQKIYEKLNLTNTAFKTLLA